MKNIFKTLKGKLLLIGIAVLLIVAVVVALVFFREDGYRSIAVKQLEGTTIIKNNQDEKEAYKGMHIKSGDDVTVQEKSNLTLLMDSDKYLYAEAGTHFEVECVDGEKSGKKVIHLKEGSVLARLKNPLKDGEVYEVETPSGTMAVRGTVFRISVGRDEEGLVQTGVQVFDGKVQVDLRKENGEYNGVSENFEAGEAGAIIGNTEFAEFVKGEDGSNKQEIEYKELPKDVAKVLVDYIDDGEELCIDKELLMDYTKLEEHKMETRVGKEATCTEDGYQEVCCVVCNEVTENVIIPATGHNMSEWEIVQKSTCVETGKRQRNCTICQNNLEEEIIPATGHSMSEWKSVQEPTCVETGKRQRNCTVCQNNLEEETISALGHTEGETKLVSEATCTQEGLSQTTCTVCKQVINSTSAKALGHTFGAWSVKNEAKCVEEGTQVRNCTRCGTEETQSIAALGHILSSNHEHQDLVRQGTDYVSCTCITACTRAGCGETFSVSATVSNSVLGIMVQYFCNNCGDQI